VISAVQQGILTPLHTLVGSGGSVVGFPGSTPLDRVTDQLKATEMMLSVGVEYVLTARLQIDAFSAWNGSIPTQATADSYTGDNGVVARLKVVPEPPGLALFLAALGVAGWAVRQP
jgi:hypothetical protein